MQTVVFIEKVLDQRGEVVRPLAQGGDSQGNDVQAVVEILSKAAFANGLLRVHIGGGNDSDVNRDRIAPTDPIDLALLQDSEQLCLQVNGDLRYFIQEQRAAVGKFKLALLAFDRPCESPLLVAEQLAFE